MTASRPTAFSKPVLLIAIALLVGGSVAGPVFAQSKDDDADTLEEKPQSYVGGRTAAGAAERAKQRKQQKQEQVEAGPAKFPLATRAEPNLRPTNKGGKALREILAAYDGQKYAETIAKAEALGGDAGANAYDKSFAYQLAASAAIDMADDAKAIDYYKKAIDNNGLDNNGHYQVMYNLAVMQHQAEKPTDALATLDRFLTETKSDKPEAISFKAGLLGELDRAPEAAAMYEKILATKPNDKTTIINAAALYQQAGDTDRALALLENARKQGLLTENKEYRILYVSYINAEKYKDALAIIDEGLAKGAIKPSNDLAIDYSVIAQNVYAQENTALAIDLYKRAAKVASNGEPAMNLARVLRNEGRIAEAKQAAREALAKGLKKPEDANKILALPGK